MTAEEIERAFQQVALSIQQLTQVAVGTDARLDASDTARREANERIEALINAQVRYEARQEKLEEAFRQVAAAHVQLVEMIRLHENRLDGHDGANAHAESRLDALINSQIQLTERVDTLTMDIAAVNGGVERIGDRLDQAAALQAANAEQIKALIAAQARTDEQIRLLLDRNGSPKIKAKKAVKRAKKTGKRGSAK
jgi:SHS2 domain-containing protein